MKRLCGRDIARLKGVVQGAPLIGPRSVNVHLTNVCNLKCRFCWYHSPLVTFNQKPRELKLEVFKRLVDDCPAAVFRLLVLGVVVGWITHLVTPMNSR